jgi:hypothetical protein
MLSRASRPMGRVASRGGRAAVRRSALPSAVVGRTLTTHAKASGSSNVHYAAYGDLNTQPWS